jgi:hypothetical protein
MRHRLRCKDMDKAENGARRDTKGGKASPREGSQKRDHSTLPVGFRRTRIILSNSLYLYCGSEKVRCANHDLVEASRPERRVASRTRTPAPAARAAAALPPPPPPPRPAGPLRSTTGSQSCPLAIGRVGIVTLWTCFVCYEG